MSAEYEKFQKWFVGQGGEVLAPTNEWEKLRWRYGTRTLLVYQRKTRRESWCPASREAYECFKAGRNLPWKKTTKRGNLGGKYNAILDRDGDACFFCRKPLGTDMTIEHLVAKVHGGPDHISNLFLAHKKCNEAAGHLSAVEKIRARERAAEVFAKGNER